MPVLIAVGIATVVVATVLGLAARTGRRHDPADVRADSSAVVETAHRHPRLRRFVMARMDTTTATGLALTIALAAAAVGILAVGVILNMVHHDTGFARWDMSAARWGAAHSSRQVRRTLRAITQLGATPVAIGVAATVSVVEYLRTRTRAVPAFMAAVLGSELLVNNIVKWSVRRARPDIARFVLPHGSSFPSGHTACAAATWAAVALLVGRRRRRSVRVALAAGAGAITAAVATSRVLLGVHWLTDVIAGAFLGWTCFALCSIAFGGRLLHFGQPLETAKTAIAHDSPGPLERTAS
jgi:undecaprenyl-diphosphatase